MDGFGDIFYDFEIFVFVLCLLLSVVIMGRLFKKLEEGIVGIVYMIGVDYFVVKFFYFCCSFSEDFFNRIKMIVE